MTPRFALALALVACSQRSPAPPAASRDAAPTHDPEPAVDWTRPVPVTPPGGLAEQGYVGSAACQPCHEEIAKRYAGHSMARSGMRPLASLDQKWLASIFDAGAKTPVTHHGGYTYRPVRDGDHYFIEETLLAKDGTRLSTWTQPVDFMLSAGRYGAAFYFRQGGKLYQAPIDYYGQVSRWDIDPGASEGNFRFSRPLDAFCISCHSDYPRRTAGADGQFTDLPGGVGCERCHGPGAQHVKTLKPEDVVNPAKLSAARQLDVCAQCHESSSAILRAGQHDFGYRPGTPLTNVRMNWVPEPPEQDRERLLTHADRLLRSACWRGSAGKLACTSCHDPHVSSFDQPIAYWDAKCNACHGASKQCTADHAARMNEGDHCIRCHMARRPSADVPLVTVTDHWIQRRPPPNRAGRLDIPDTLVPWSTFTGEPATGTDLAALEAVVALQAGMKRDHGMVMDTVAQSRPPVAKLYEMMAGHARAPGARARVYATVFGFDPDARGALLGYARAQLDTGTPAGAAEATHALDRMLALDPDDTTALETKGIMLFRAGHPDQAQPLFEHAAAAGPMAAISHVGLAALALQAGKRDDAIAQLQVPRRIEPADAWILDQLTAAYTAAGDRAHVDEIAHAREALVAVGKTPAVTPATAWLPR